MPYNNAPIGPSEEITGSSKLPLARVKKIISQDDEISAVTNSAAFAISVATEIFVRYLTEQSYTVVKSEKKPRRNLAYKDVSTAVSRIDSLEFLSDVVPRTKTYRQVREEKAREDVAAAEKAKASAARANGTNGEQQHSKSIDQMLRQIDGEATPDSEPNGLARMQIDSLQSGGQSTLVERTILQNGHARTVSDRNATMTG